MFNASEFNPEANPVLETAKALVFSGRLTISCELSQGK